MVQIWYMETYPLGDPRLPHQQFPPKKLTPDELTKKTGTFYYKLDTLDTVQLHKRLTIVKLERNFSNEDVYTLDAENTINFEDKIEELFEESETYGDQGRMIIEGAAYYDVEDGDGNWVRILCEYGDFIIIPAGKPYRFTTTPKVKQIKQSCFRAAGRWLTEKNEIMKGKGKVCVSKGKCVDEKFCESGG